MGVECRVRDAKKKSDNGGFRKHDIKRIWFITLETDSVTTTCHIEIELGSLGDSTQYLV